MTKSKTQEPSEFEVKEAFANLMFKIGGAYKKASSLSQEDIKHLKLSGLANYFQPKTETPEETES